MASTRYSYPILLNGGHSTSQLVASGTSASSAAELIAKYAARKADGVPGVEMEVTMPKDKIKELLNGDVERLDILVRAYEFGKRDTSRDISLTVYKAEMNTLLA
ncbi:hypothetical protein FGG69_gp09 [Salinibacter phage SRUTV-1]|uniref:Uncharacterized protein n=1 Tax=Salinibacter phage SRUTV-1 TaxID=2684227 RepID=A0A2D3FAK0_9CAUD|nr:hypothetical protein FGG69_gp09 [Salinibacter phage SRUTV-1]ATU47042.1 hypothetical protein [Salinibacter phage SRUTV-1]